MRLETLPVIIGALFALAGLALIADASIPDGAMVRPERRRRPRPQRHLAGEGVLGLGIVCVAVALIASDAWRYTTVAILAALILCVVGVALNWRYVRGMMLGEAAAPPERGAAPRPAPASPSPGLSAPPPAAPADGERRPEPRVSAR